MGELAIWKDFGLAGLVIAGLFAHLHFLIKVHRDERKEFLVTHRELSERQIQVQQETNAVISSLADTMREANLRARRYECEGR